MIGMADFHRVFGYRYCNKKGGFMGDWKELSGEGSRPEWCSKTRLSGNHHFGCQKSRETTFFPILHDAKSRIRELTIVFRGEM